MRRANTLQTAPQPNTAPSAPTSSKPAAAPKSLAPSPHPASPSSSRNARASNFVASCGVISLLLCALPPAALFVGLIGYLAFSLIKTAFIAPLPMFLCYGLPALLGIALVAFQTRARSKHSSTSGIPQEATHGSEASQSRGSKPSWLSEPTEDKQTKATKRATGEDKQIKEAERANDCN